MVCISDYLQVQTRSSNIDLVIIIDVPSLERELLSRKTSITGLKLPDLQINLFFFLELYGPLRIPKFGIASSRLSLNLELLQSNGTGGVYGFFPAS